MRFLLALVLCASAHAATDAYGGDTARPCSGGVNDHFYTEKIASRWWLCTPAGNAMFLHAVYNVKPPDSGVDYQSVNGATVIAAKYAEGPTADSTENWAELSVQRLKSWGFNGIGEYGITAVWPTHTDWNWAGITDDQTIPSHVPFIAIITPALYAMTNSSSYISGGSGAAIKDLMYGIKAEVYTGYRSELADMFDSGFEEWMTGQLENDTVIQQAWLGPNSEYFIGFTVDESDNMWGFGSGPDFPTVAGGKIDAGYDQPHLGWMVLVTAPTQASNTEKSITYTDTEVLSKTEFSTWLSTRYSASISALNTAWGSYYTTFGTQGAGFGVGTGVLDEDGLCPAKGVHDCWVPTDAKSLTGATASMKADLDAFLLYFARHYFSTVKTVLDAEVPGHLYFGTLTGGWGTPSRAGILQAMGEYADVLQVVQLPPNCSDCTDSQARVNFAGLHGGDKPWLQWDGFASNPDSYMSPWPTEAGAAQSATQEARGAVYAARVASYLASKDAANIFHTVGFQWWEMYDNRAEQLNWGLLTRRDNAYDGVEVVTGTVACAAPLAAYSCGGELALYGAPYGDFITSVKAANALWLALDAEPVPNRVISGQVTTSGRVQ